MMLKSSESTRFYHYKATLKPDATLFSVFEKVKNPNYNVLLQSSDAYLPKTSRYSIIPVLPEKHLLFNHGKLIIHDLSVDKLFQNQYSVKTFDDLHNILIRFLNSPDNCSYSDEINHLPFISGFVGFLSYDLIRYIEKLPDVALPIDFPVLEFIFTSSVITFDHKLNEVWITSNSKTKLDLLIQMLNTPEIKEVDSFNISLLSPMETSFSESEFIDMVEKVKDYISQGEIYQANISIRFAQMLDVNPYLFYKKLYNLNPSPFSAYIQLDDLFIVCNSPERLVKKTLQGRLETRPIAGTRGRSKIFSVDSELQSALLQSSKERAEHIMLVDLERNDLNKVVKYNTLKVDELFTIEKYSHVMHIVSNVTGETQSNIDFMDIIKAVFPGGTITGVPKIRCMEIIDEIEPVQRGLYTGSIGYIDSRGSMDLNIVIRTMVLNRLNTSKYNAIMQFGAGIVADSNGEHEYNECIKKGQAIFDLLNSV